MLSEPLSITYDGAAKSFNRIAFANEKEGSASQFVTSDGQFDVFIRQTDQGQMLRYEVSLGRRQLDNDANPFTGNWSDLPNRVGLVFEVNRLRFNSSTDLPLLQSALLAWCDSTVRGRIVAGEA
jgi:hypothetical protein